MNDKYWFDIISSFADNCRAAAENLLQSMSGENNPCRVNSIGLDGMLSSLDSSFITPIERSDIYRLASCLFTLQNKICAASELVADGGFSAFRTDEIDASESILRLMNEAVGAASLCESLNERKKCENTVKIIHTLVEKAENDCRRALLSLFRSHLPYTQICRHMTLISSQREIIHSVSEFSDAFILAGINNT